MATRDIVIVILILAGCGFMLVSAIGIVRLPDVFARMHAAGKASTVGVSGLLLAAGLFFYDEFLMLRMLALIALIFATAPIATTAMARAAYRTGPRKRKHLHYDEMVEATPAAPAQASETANEPVA
jgi:multicomponent Na+:H+ antiporter subunit G